MTPPSRRRTRAVRALVVVAATAALLLTAGDVARAGTLIPNPHEDHDHEEVDIAPDAGRIIGSPDPGPDPENPGDRGGWAQFLVLGAIAGGVGFIMWRITHSARRVARSATADP